MPDGAASLLYSISRFLTVLSEVIEQKNTLCWLGITYFVHIWLHRAQYRPNAACTPLQNQKGRICKYRKCWIFKFLFSRFIDCPRCFTRGNQTKMCSSEPESPPAAVPSSKSPQRLTGIHHGWRKTKKTKLANMEIQDENLKILKISIFRIWTRWDFWDDVWWF